MSILFRCLVVILASFVVVALAPVLKADGATYTLTGVNSSQGDDGLAVAFEYTATKFINPAPRTFSLSDSVESVFY